MPRDPSLASPDDRQRIEHMLRAAQDARTFANGRARADLLQDAMFRRAILHSLLEIGEAASRISSPTKQRLNEIPWAQIIAARNILVHVYWGLDADLVWNMVTDDLAPLTLQLEHALASWPESQT